MLRWGAFMGFTIFQGLRMLVAEPTLKRRASLKHSNAKVSGEWRCRLSLLFREAFLSLHTEAELLTLVPHIILPTKTADFMVKKLIAFLRLFKFLSRRCVLPIQLYLCFSIFYSTDYFIYKYFFKFIFFPSSPLPYTILNMYQKRLRTKGQGPRHLIQRRLLINNMAYLCLLSVLTSSLFELHHLSPRNFKTNFSSPSQTSLRKTVDCVFSLLPLVWGKSGAMKSSFLLMFRHGNVKYSWQL